MVSVAILLSRQSLQPCSANPWIQATISAVLWAAEQGYSLHTSLGMTTWEIVLTLASQNSIPVILHLPATDAYNPALLADLEQDFGLPPKTVEIVSIDDNRSSPTSKQTMLQRDRSVVSAADVIIPISVRPSGHMEDLITWAEDHGRTVVDTFRVPYIKRQHQLAYKINQANLNPKLSRFSPNDYLFHWTRSCNGPWPGEKPLEFYSALLASSSYPRDALATLHRILKSYTIIATGRHMPRRVKTVSFTACDPIAMIPHMRWRARWREMSFEPYGIGITAKLASRIGIEPVIYVDHQAKSTTESWRTQTRGGKTDWRLEREFRYRGDLDLSSLLQDDLVIFCRFPHEAAMLQAETCLRTIPMELAGLHTS